MEHVDNIAQKDIMLLESKYVLIVVKAIIGMELHVLKSVQKVNS